MQARGEYVTVCRRDELAPGTMRWFGVNGERVLVANVEGTFYAVSDTCSHKRASLSRGKLEGCVVECPLHFATFDVRTGRFLDGPESRDIPCYKVMLAGDEVRVALA